MQRDSTASKARLGSRGRAFLVSFPLLALSIAFAQPLKAQKHVTLTASDGVKVYGDFYPSASKSQPYILLFHQAGSNRGEYAPIAPRLAKLGFNCLAIDQRSGGERWGQQNETVQHLGRSADYLDALKDMEAALDWARISERSGKVIVWGSSYSSALVFLLAAQHPDDVAGILSFSPGEYLGSSDLVHKAAAKISLPVYVTSAKEEEEIDAAKSILAASPWREKTQFVPRIAGVHGSSTLRMDRNPTGEAENWRAVEEFLNKFKGKR